MQTITLANQKGGVGKSSVARLLAHYLARTGRRVLAIDLDHQGNFTRPLLASGKAIAAPLAASMALAGEGRAVPAGDLILVPADSEGLLALERKGAHHNTFATNFLRFIRAQAGRFDACVIDTNPNPDIRLISAMIASRFVLSPVQLNQEAISGIGGLIKHPHIGVQKIKEKLNPQLEFMGILPTLVEPTPFQRANFEQIVQHYAHLLIRISDAPLQFACIPKRSVIAEAQATGALLWELKKTAARDAWREIEPTLRVLAERMELAVERAVMSARQQPSNIGVLDLSALNLEPATSAPSDPHEVSIESVYEDPHNPRTVFEPQELERLARDIAQRGILQPIVVWPRDAAGYRIRYGARRRRAAALAGLTRVPIVINDRIDLDDFAQVAENVHRARLSPMDLAQFIERKLKQGQSAAEIARSLSLDKASITHHSALLDHPPAIARLYEEGRCMSAKTLYELRNLYRESPDTVSALIESDAELTRATVRALARTLSTARQLNARARATGEEGTSRLPPPPPSRAAHLLH